MGVVNTKATELSNVEASPIVANQIHNIHGRIRIKSATLSVDSGDDDTSVYRFFRVRSSDSIKEIRCYHDSITSGNDWDCGLYTINSGAAVDEDLYGDGYTLAVACPAVPHVVATAAYLSMRFGDATTAAITDVNNMVWEDLGLSADPGLEYDLVLTANTVGSATGDITIMVYYTAGD